MDYESTHNHTKINSLKLKYNSIKNYKECVNGGNSCRV